MELDFKLVELGKSAPHEVLSRLPQGSEISAVASHYLKQFSDDQLSQLLDTLDQAIATVIRIESDLAPEMDIERSDERDLHWIHISAEFHNFSYLNDIPGIDHGHFYALYALHQLGAAAEQIRQLPPGEFNEASVNHLVDAVESMSTAKFMFERTRRSDINDASDSVWDSWDEAPEDTLEQRVKRIKSEEAKKAALQRHARAYRAQAKAVELYNSRPFTSFEAAAAFIAPIVHITPRVVAKWLSKYTRDPVAFMTQVKRNLPPS